MDGVYHADPHRGNVLLTDDGRLALLDFGLLGRLDSDTRQSLALLVALAGFSLSGLIGLYIVWRIIRSAGEF